MALARRGTEALAKVSTTALVAGVARCSCHLMQNPSGVFMHNAVSLCSIQMAAPLLGLTSSSIPAQSLFIVLRELVSRPESLAVLICLLQVRVWISVLGSAETRIALVV